MISIFIAACHRPKMFETMLESLYATTKGFDVEVIAVIDEDVVSAGIAASFNVDVIDFSVKKRGALRAWNLGLIHSTGDILTAAGDDQLFHEGWLHNALKSHQERLSGFGVVGMNDLAYDGNLQLATMFLFSRDYCKRHMGGIFAPPMYTYLNIDSEWNAKAKELGCFYWEKNSIVEHLHSAHGKRPYDKHDLWKDESNLAEKDNAIFEDRKARCFPIEWEPLI